MVGLPHRYVCVPSATSEKRRTPRIAAPSDKSRSDTLMTQGEGVIGDVCFPHAGEKIGL